MNSKLLGLLAEAESIGMPFTMPKGYAKMKADLKSTHGLDLDKEVIAIIQEQLANFKANQDK